MSARAANRGSPCQLALADLLHVRLDCSTRLRDGTLGLEPLLAQLLDLGLLAVERGEIAPLQVAVRRHTGKVVPHTLLILHDVEGYSLNELEKITDLKLGTIKSKLHRARVKLGRMLQAGGDIADPESLWRTRS